MFVLEPSKRFIDSKTQTVLTFIQSINLPMVAAGDHPAEETQAFVFTVQNVNRSLETFIYLHLQESNQCVLYVYDESPYMGDRLDEAEGEASDFVESMGFMMDNMRINKMSESERKMLIYETPAFYEDLKDYEPILEAKNEQRQKDTHPPLEEGSESADSEEVEGEGGFLEPEPFEFPEEQDLPSIQGLKELDSNQEVKVLKPDEISDLSVVTNDPSEAVASEPVKEQETSAEQPNAQVSQEVTLDPPLVAQPEDAEIEEIPETLEKPEEEVEDFSEYFEPKEQTESEEIEISISSLVEDDDTIPVLPSMVSDSAPEKIELDQESPTDEMPIAAESVSGDDHLSDDASVQEVSTTDEDLAALQDIESSLENQNPQVMEVSTATPPQEVTNLKVSQDDWQDLMRLLLTL